MRNVVQDAAFGREAILLPEPLDMDQRGLSQAIDGMLQRGERDGIVVSFAASARRLRIQNKLEHLDAFRQTVAVDRDLIIGEPPGGGQLSRRSLPARKLVADLAAAPSRDRTEHGQRHCRARRHA